MKTLTLHLGKNLLISTLIALGVLTFVMLSGHFFRAFDLLAQGLSPLFLVKYLLLMIPDMLRFTLPLSILVATVLVFGRMSSDNEIVAMKASGINLWQIISPGIVLSSFFSILCLCISLVISPLCRYKATSLEVQVLTNAPLALLEPGIFTALSNQCHIRFRDRNGDELDDIHIIMKNGENSIQDIVARRGRLRTDEENMSVDLELEDAFLSDIDFSTGEALSKRHLKASSLRLPIDYGAKRRQRRASRKPRYMDVKMLFGQIRLLKEDGDNATALLLNLHNRLSLALSPFAFLLLGIPFGIRGKRSELSVGLLICVLLALGFYVFLLLADMLEGKPQIHPEWIVWLPNLIYQIGGIIAIKKLNLH